MCLKDTQHYPKKSRQNEASSSANTYMTTKTQTKTYQYSCLKPIKILFFAQVFFRVILPTLDTFVDLGGLFPFDAYSNLLGVRGNDTICCPGAGFSGFWFSLGRLHALLDSESRRMNDIDFVNIRDHDNINSKMNDISIQDSVKFECFSAGCLGVVASLMNLPIETVLDLALEAQTLWNEGIIGRFDVVEHFVDGLIGLDGTFDESGVEGGGGGRWNNQQAEVDLSFQPNLRRNAHFSGDKIDIKDNLDEAGSERGRENQVGMDLNLQYNNTGVRQRMLTKELLSRINIITASRGERMQIQTISRTPVDIHELRELLIQTTWM